MTASQNVDYSIMAGITAKPMPPRPIAIEVSRRMWSVRGWDSDRGGLRLNPEPSGPASAATRSNVSQFRPAGPSAK